VASIDRKQIATVALALIDEGGSKALTMRAVAEALGVSAMALYHYVDDKTALVALVVDEAISERPLPSPTGAGWKQDVLELARWMREGALLRPGIARLRQEHRVWTPTVMSLGERWLGIWQQSGLPLDEAAEAAMTTLMAINGMVDQEAALPSFELPDEDSLAWFPNLRVAFSGGQDRNREAAFELVVRSVVDGVHRELGARVAIDAEKGSAVGRGTTATKSRTRNVATKT
jgi:AcrR family transcriptional regulator